VLDSTFGSGGTVTTSFGQVDSAAAVLIQTDGKIVAAGNSGFNTQQGFIDSFALARYLGQ
jgi:hypothetical protein